MSILGMIQVQGGNSALCKFRITCVRTFQAELADVIQKCAVQCMLSYGKSVIES